MPALRALAEKGKCQHGSQTQVQAGDALDHFLTSGRIVGRVWPRRSRALLSASGSGGRLTIEPCRFAVVVPVNPASFVTRRKQ
jgi:hypothetical protein